MCGICGEIDFYNKNVRVDSVRKMCNVLAHRGPDDEGMVFIQDDKPLEVGRPSPAYLGENGFKVGLGHRRLSIIDLSKAARSADVQ